MIGITKKYFLGSTSKRPKRERWEKKSTT